MMFIFNELTVIVLRETNAHAYKRKGIKFDHDNSNEDNNVSGLLSVVDPAEMSNHALRSDMTQIR